MRTLEKSLTTSHPFHAKLVCHWPQINYQESGREQMWPTPNWLHQHSVCLSFFPSCFALFCYSLPLKAALLSPLPKRKSVQYPSLFWSWPKHVSCTLQALESSFHLLVSVPLCRCTNCSYHLKCNHMEYRGGPPNPISTPVWMNVWQEVR